MTGLVLFGCFPYTTEIRSRACLRWGGHTTTCLSHLLHAEFDNPAVAFINLLLPPWEEPLPGPSPPELAEGTRAAVRDSGDRGSYSQASNMLMIKSLSSHTSGRWYRGKIRHPANNKYWKQDCFRAGWELKSSGQIKSLTKRHLSVSPSADQQAHQHLVFSVSFLLCQLFFTSCLLVMQQSISPLDFSEVFTHSEMGKHCSC